VRVTLNVNDQRSSPTELKDWLNSQPQLRGRIHLIESRRQSAAMTETVVALAADLGPPGLAALGTALVAWLRHRTSDVRLTVRRQDGTRFDISTRRVRGMNPAEIKALVDQLSATADDQP
jgi:hypothetical protein